MIKSQDRPEGCTGPNCYWDEISSPNYFIVHESPCLLAVEEEKPHEYPPVYDRTLGAYINNPPWGKPSQGGHF